MEENLLKSMDLKNTKKRQVILSILKEYNYAMTAEEIYEKTKPLLSMSVSTIYRALHTLSDKNIVIKSIRQDGKSYYQLQKYTHKHHLVCTVCQEVITIEHCPLEELEQKLAVHTGYQITGHSLEFFGICPNCTKK